MHSYLEACFGVNDYTNQLPKSDAVYKTCNSHFSKVISW